MLANLNSNLVRAWAWRLRWLGVLLLVVVLARLVVPGVIQATRQTSPAVVLTRSVSLGQTIQSSDVALRQVAKELRPAGALETTEAAVGQRLAASLPAGMVLVEQLLTGPGAASGAPAGTVVMPVRLSDGAVASLLSTGDRIDVLAAAGASASGAVAPAQRLASGAIVIALAEPADRLMEPGLLLLAVTPAEAELLSGAASWAVISAVLVG